MYFWLIFFAVVALLPLYYLLITSFKSLEEATTTATMIPHSFELIENIKFVLNHEDYNVVRMFFNTVLVFVLKAAGTCLTCSFAAYGFAKFRFPGKNALFFVMLATMMVPGELLGIPIYEFMVNTGLKNVFYIPLWVSCWFGTDVFMIFMFKQFFESLPKDYLEAARIDGCGEFRAFFKIVVPLNVPVYTTVILLYFIGTYNDLYGPALYVTEKKDWLMANSISIFENLYKAHKRARCCKRHKKDVILFEMNLAENLWNIKNSLENHTYKVAGYNKFMIYDPKEREIQALSYYDRIVQHVLCDQVLTPFF